MKNKLVWMLSLLVLASLILAACGGAAQEGEGTTFPGSTAVTTEDAGGLPETGATDMPLATADTGAGTTATTDAGGAAVTATMDAGAETTATMDTGAGGTATPEAGGAATTDAGAAVTATMEVGAGSGAAVCTGVADADLISQGEEVFTTQCAACHGQQGEGQGDFPALAGNEELNAEDPSVALQAFMNPQVHPFIEDMEGQEIAAVFSYIRGNWGNNGTVVCPEDIDALQPAQ